MTSPSTPEKQAQSVQDTPSRLKKVNSSTAYQSDVLVDARRAVLDDLGSHIPEIPFQTFLKYLAPIVPSFDLNSTMQSLKSGPQPVLSHSNRWSDFPKAPKDDTSEDIAFSPLPEVFTKVVAAIIANSDGNLKEDMRTLDFLQNPYHTPTSAERRNDSRPDGYLVLKDRKKVMSKDGTKENIHWADIVLSCEYKRKDGDSDLNDVRIHPGL